MIGQPGQVFLCWWEPGTPRFTDVRLVAEVCGMKLYEGYSVRYGRTIAGIVNRVLTEEEIVLITDTMEEL